MKVYAEYDVILPDYSLNYLINGDSSGLLLEDRIIVDNYMQQFYDYAREVGGDVVISLPNFEADPYFTWNPAFGLACNVYDVVVSILVSED